MVRRRYKRPFDLAFLVLSHLLLLPIWAALWALIPLAIKLGDGGPVFYTQTRLGLNGKPFNIIKFRTMIEDAESEVGPVWASKGDARVTAVGRVLRRAGLDEMPQVINILKGDISLVGPRPERPVLAERFSAKIPDFPRRLSVKPGIAGLAQVRGKYSTNPRNKLRYDLLYIRRMSPWMDFKLVFLSTWVALSRLFVRS